MTEPENKPRGSETKMLRDKTALTAPLLYLSSAQAGWEGLVAQAFHEPAQLEGWMVPAASDISLIVFAGGAMRMEWRSANGSWKKLDARQEDLILRPGSGTALEVRWESLSSLPTRTLHLQLSRDLLLCTAGEIADGDPARLSLMDRAGFQDPLLAHIGFALWRELELDAPGGKLYAQTAAQMLAVHLLRHYTVGGGDIREPAAGLTHRQLGRVMDFVRAYLDQDLSLEALARQAGFSPYHFARLFRRTTGESPHQFVLRLRIERAQQLLRGKDMPLARVAVESGFANQSHMTQAFKQYLGLTPLAYRREHTT